MMQPDTTADLDPSQWGPEDLDPAVNGLRHALRGLSAEHCDHVLAPEFDVRITVGSDHQPVIVIDVRVDLDEDFDADDWPGDEVADLKRRVRQTVRGTEADRHDWFVALHAKAGATA